jgi:UDP-GlcNAc:undecaprenyl-phosphate GlcNAc-1-phosphate transferase
MFYTALLLSLIFTPISNKIAYLLGVLDRPDPRKIHSTSVPRLGGLAMVVSLFLSLLLCVKLTPFHWAFILGAAVIVFVGLIDDKVTISPRLKFLGEILAVLIFILMSGNQLSDIGNLLGFGTIKTGSFIIPITVFAMVGCINALNLSDGLDGLAGGITAIALIFFLPLCYESQQYHLLSLTVILFGVVLGFLRYNTFPAKLFMGDSGSLLLGYSLACIAVSVVQSPLEPQVHIFPVTVFTLLSLPIVDTLYVMTCRLYRHKNLVSPDRTHLHHRLMGMGFSHSTVVAIIYGMMFAFGFLSWKIRDWREWQQFALLIAIYSMLYFLLWLVGKKGIVYSSLPFFSIKVSRKTSYYAKFSEWVGRSNRYAPYVFSLFLIAPAFFIPTTSAPFVLLALSISLFVILLYPWKGKAGEMRLANALIFISVFSLIILYLFTPNLPPWLPLYLLYLSIVTFIWVVLRIVFKGRSQVILPTSFELLLISVSWFIPLVWGQAAHMETDVRQRILLACVLSIPFLAGSKAMLRRDTKRNRGFVLLLLGALFYIGVRSTF